MGTENVQGEVQKKLDVISNEILLEANEWGGHLAGMASEEMDNAYQIPGKYPKGAYLLVFDPLDGSSNIDVNVSVGTIFSVLRCPDRNGESGDLGEEAFLQLFQPARVGAEIGAQAFQQGFCLGQRVLRGSQGGEGRGGLLVRRGQAFQGAGSVAQCGGGAAAATPVARLQLG